MKIKSILGLATLLGTMFMATQMVQAADYNFQLGTPIDYDTFAEVDTLNSGDRISVPLTVEGFSATPLQDYDVWIEYDETLLTPYYDSVTGSCGDNQMPGSRGSVLGAMQCGMDTVTEAGGVTNKVVKMNWYTTVATNTVADGTVIAYINFDVNANSEANIDSALSMYLIKTVDSNDANNAAVPLTSQVGGGIAISTVVNKASVFSFDVPATYGKFIHEVWVDVDGTKYQLTKCIQNADGSYTFNVNIKNTGTSNQYIASLKVYYGLADTEDATSYDQVFIDEYTNILVEKF